jgi:hypothetical protein
MVAELEQAILGIMTLPAIWTNQEVMPLCTSAVVFFGDRKADTATAGDEKHAQRLIRDDRLTLALLRHYGVSSTMTAPVLFLRRFACKVFLRKRRDLGVISTNSSSAINSIACSRFN